MQPIKNVLSKRNPVRSNRASAEDWWAPIWRGLAVSPSAKHYKAMHTALWLFIYLLLHADRRSGKLYRRVDTIAVEMGIKPRAIRYWLTVLRKGKYIITSVTGRSLEITIEKWKPLKRRQQ